MYHSTELAVEGESNFEEPFFFPQSAPKAEVHSFANSQSCCLNDVLESTGASAEPFVSLERSIVKWLAMQRGERAAQDTYKGLLNPTERREGS